MKRQTKHRIAVHVVRGIFVLLTLALPLWMTPSAPGQRGYGESNRRSLTFPSSLLQKQQPNNHQVQTAPDSVKNRHQAPARAPEEGRPASLIQGVPSGIDCDNAPGIQIHDDGTVESGYSGGP
jgi:hypothetical protein